MSRCSKFMTGVSLGLGLLVASAIAKEAGAVPWTKECIIKFSNPDSLSRIFEQARGGFAVPTKWENGVAKTCDDVSVPGCYVYNQECAFLKEVMVVPVGVSHFHLLFTDPTIGDCFLDNGLARVINGVCVAPNWVKEPRRLYPHGPIYFTRVTVQGISAPIPFDVSFMEVGGTESVDLVYEKTAGGWWIWHNLPPGAHNLTSLTSDIKSLYIRGSKKNGGPPTIVSFRARV